MSDSSPYVSRGGEKLAAALDAFELDVAGLVCADFGSHVGGFVDCLLQRGAARVYAIDPGYGVLDYALRHDPRVAVRERTNALQYVAEEPCDLISIDVGWTPQRLILPVARRCLKAGGAIVTLVKPQYEAPKGWLRGGVVPPERLEQVLATCREDVAEAHLTIAGEIQSPLRGHGGNLELLWLVRAT